MDFLSLFSSYPYRNLTQSLQLRKMGTVIEFADHRGAILSWGLSILIGGEYSKANGETVISVSGDCDSPRYIYYPDDAWRSLIQNAFGDRLKNRYLNVYQFNDAAFPESYEESPCIVPVTRDFLEKNLPNTHFITDELYSYTDLEDFFQNGFGFALVIHDRVVGYCLSEYSIDGCHGINIWVDEPYRRSGYGGKMVDAFLQHCQKHHQSACWVCNADNIPSNQLAISRGFGLQSSTHFFEL